MTFSDFVNQVSPRPLLEWQKQYIEEIDKIGIENIDRIHVFGVRSGKMMMLKILNEYIQYSGIKN